MRWSFRLAAVGAAGALLGAATVPAAGPAAGQPATDGTANAAGTADAAVQALPDTTTAVTLITGDTVRLQRFEGGRQAATVEPGEGRDRVTFHTQEIDGQVRVIPADVVPYLASDQIDATLFNVTELIRQGYDDAHTDTLPLLLSYRDGTSATRRSGAGIAAATAGVELRSINGRAVRADKHNAERFWESIDDDRPAARTAAPTLAGGLDRVWLDRRVRASLDRSVKQIGAPDAWAAGYDGKGVTVAVLDTGVDADHPDLAGRIVESRDFSDSGSTADRFGHGTHVASTIVGSGAASDGTRRGVAPAADLLVGKVLGDNGFGTDSMVLAGMEWAAASDARIISMSLGGPGADGTDPLDQAVNRLSASTGKLFVVSAGNDGELGPYTIGSPGTADAALTVGAVDRDESLAPFSSRGPRQGDLAVKPDITAPGVGIVAARASGTTLGSPVDEYYTAASGTSMAAPHVSGAAAILAQQHPEWTGQQIKDALISTARTADAYNPFEQGGGRVDLTRASGQQVFGTGTLQLGRFTDDSGSGGSSDGTATGTGTGTGTGKEVHKELSYTNTSDAPVTLTLSVSLRTVDGRVLDPAAVRLDQSSVTVAPGTTAVAPITVDPSRAARGTYSGYVTATAGSTVVHTTVGLLVEGPSHSVTISGVDRQGKPAMISPLVLLGEDPRSDVLTWLPAGHSLTARVQEGTYHLQGLIEDHGPLEESAAQVVVPQLEVDRDLTVVLDARTARKVVIQTPKPSVQNGVFTYSTHRVIGSRTFNNNVMHFDGTSLYVSPTQRVTEGTFEFISRWSLTAPMLTTTVRGRDLGTVQPRFLHRSPTFAGKHALQVVDVGAGTPEELSGLDLRDKIALMTTDERGWTAQVNGVAKAGAAVALIMDVPGSLAWTKWLADGPRTDTVGMLIQYQQGQRLLDALRTGPVTLEFTGVPVSPYLYDVMQVSRQHVPGQIVERVTNRNTAQITTTYHELGGQQWAKEQRFSWRPWQSTAWGQYQHFMATPQTRVEYVTADDTTWQHDVQHRYTWDSMNRLQPGMLEPFRVYRPGQKLTDEWFGAVIRPAIPRGLGLTSHRTGDVMTIRIPEFADAQRGHFGRQGSSDERDTVAAKLYRDGTLVHDGDEAWGDYPASAGPANYRLDLSVRRGSAEWLYSTRTDTSWTFSSRRPATDMTSLLPLLQLDYDVDVDVRNQARDDHRFTFSVTARHQDGLTGARAAVAGIQTWVSYDDGATWTKADRLRNTGGGTWAATVTHPKAADSNGFVSLRVRAWDRAGNTVEQTVLHAYGLRGD